MNRVSDEMIKKRIARLQKEGMDVGLDGQYGRWRVTTKSGARNLSDRTPNREIWEWLIAFEEGWDQHNQVVKANLKANPMWDNFIKSVEEDRHGAPTD